MPSFFGVEYYAKGARRHLARLRGKRTFDADYFLEGANRHLARLGHPPLRATPPQRSQDQPADMIPLALSGHYGGDLLAVAKCPRCGHRICWNEFEPQRKEQWWPDDGRWWAECCGLRWEAKGVMFHVTVRKGA